MTALYAPLFVVAMFGLGCIVAHITRPKPKKRVRKPFHTANLDLDFTQLERRK